jgi:hypothetical protein
MKSAANPIADFDTVIAMKMGPSHSNQGPLVVPYSEKTIAPALLAFDQADGIVHPEWLRKEVNHPGNRRIVGQMFDRLGIIDEKRSRQKAWRDKLTESCQ